MSSIRKGVIVIPFTVMLIAYKIGTVIEDKHWILKIGYNFSIEQTALMQACQYGHWEVVQTLILYKANV